MLRWEGDKKNTVAFPIQNGVEKKGCIFLDEIGLL